MARNVDCVGSGEDLYREFLRKGSLMAPDRYRFDVNLPTKQFYTSYTTFTVVYNTTTVAEIANGNDSIVYEQTYTSSDRCCNTSGTDCIVLQSATQAVYQIIPPQLIYKLVEPIFTLLRQRRGTPVYEFIGCWSTPPFCSQNNIALILRDFTGILVGSSLLYVSICKQAINCALYLHAFTDQ